jgi:hypothetical protein
LITGKVDVAPNVIVDRELITGPRSDHPIGKKLAQALDHTLVSG